MKLSISNFHINDVTIKNRDSLKGYNKFIERKLMIIPLIISLCAIFYGFHKVFLLLQTVELQTILGNNHMLGAIMYFGICFLQPILLPLPEPMTVMAGSAVLGPFLAAIVGFVGTFLGILTMFGISKYGSRKLLARIIDQKKLDQFNYYVRKNETIVVLGLFILPILPDEIICIGAGLAGVKPLKFILIAALSKLITSFGLAYSIDILNLNVKSVSLLFIIGMTGYLIWKGMFQKQKA